MYHILAVWRRHTPFDSALRWSRDAKQHLRSNTTVSNLVLYSVVEDTYGQLSQLLVSQPDSVLKTRLLHIREIMSKIKWVVSESVLQNNIILRIVIQCVIRATDYHGNANLTAPQAPKVHVSKLSHIFNFCGPGYPPNLFGFWI
eukprot:sb/3473980/